MNDPVLAADWHAVAQVDALAAGQVIGTTVLDEAVVLWRDAAGAAHAFVDRCPHRGARLSLGQVRDGTSLQCPYHGWRFNGAGHCVLVPAQPGLPVGPKSAAHALPLLEAWGLVWISFAATPPAPPEMPDVDDDYALVLDGPYDVQTSAPRVVENFLDMAHFPFIHSGYLGAEPHTAIADYRVELTPAGLTATGCKAYQPKTTSVSTAATETAYTYLVPRPLRAVLTKAPGAPGEKPTDVIMLAATPTTELRTQIWFVMAMTYAKGLPPQQFRDFQRDIFMQDKAVLESQRPQRLPLDPSAECHQRADRLSLTYRRWLRELGMRFGVIGLHDTAAS